MLACQTFATKREPATQSNIIGNLWKNTTLRHRLMLVGWHIDSCDTVQYHWRLVKKHNTATQAYATPVSGDDIMKAALKQEPAAQATCPMLLLLSDSPAERQH